MSTPDAGPERSSGAYCCFISRGKHITEPCLVQDSRASVPDGVHVVTSSTEEVYFAS